MPGQDFTKLWDYAAAEMLKLGMHTETEVESTREALKEDIRSAG